METCQVCGSYSVTRVTWDPGKDEWQGWCAAHMPPGRKELAYSKTFPLKPYGKYAV